MFFYYTVILTDKLFCLESLFAIVLCAGLWLSVSHSLTPPQKATEVHIQGNKSNLILVFEDKRMRLLQKT